MSHSSAQFRFKDGTEFHGEYNGTSDIMCPRMFETPEKRDEQWRKQEWPMSDCEHEKEVCIAHADYGGGFWWEGTACRTCMVFCGPHDLFDYTTGIYIKTYNDNQTPVSPLLP